MVFSGLLAKETSHTLPDSLNFTSAGSVSLMICNGARVLRMALCVLKCCQPLKRTISTLRSLGFLF